MRRLLLAAVPCLSFALLLAAGRAARGDDPPAPGGAAKPATPSAPAEKGAPVEKGPDIAWRASWTEAVEEASERNVLVYLHSPGST